MNRRISTENVIYYWILILRTASYSFLSLFLYYNTRPIYLNFFLTKIHEEEAGFNFLNLFESAWIW